jgi:hypothetical protein
MIQYLQNTLFFHKIKPLLKNLHSILKKDNVANAVKGGVISCGGS